LALAAAAACCLAVPAQAEDAYIYATYFNCDVTQQERADQIIEQLDKPLWDAAVADGSIQSWGWLAHHTGGKWRRAQYYMAPTMDALFAAQKKVGDAADAKDPKAGKEFGKICNAHDDYIWKRVAGNTGDGPRGNVSFSTYHVCEMTREQEADQLVQKVFAPVYDKLITDGVLVSWGFFEHIVGGQYRRLDTMSAKDLPTLMKARGAIIEALEDDKLGNTYSDICGSHSDYIWDIKFATP
jgi:hypothetical protein